MASLPGVGASLAGSRASTGYRGPFTASATVEACKPYPWLTRLLYSTDVLGHERLMKMLRDEAGAEEYRKRRLAVPMRPEEKAALVQAFNDQRSVFTRRFNEASAGVRQFPQVFAADSSHSPLVGGREGKVRGRRLPPQRVERSAAAAYLGLPGASTAAAGGAAGPRGRHQGGAGYGVAVSQARELNDMHAMPVPRGVGEHTAAMAGLESARHFTPASKALNPWHGVPDARDPVGAGPEVGSGVPRFAVEQRHVASRAPPGVAVGATGSSGPSGDGSGAPPGVGGGRGAGLSASARFSSRPRSGGRARRLKQLSGSQRAPGRARKGAAARRKPGRRYAPRTAFAEEDGDSEYKQPPLPTSTFNERVRPEDLKSLEMWWASENQRTAYERRQLKQREKVSAFVVIHAHKNARTVQRVWRGFLGRRYAHRVYWATVFNLCASTIQAQARGFLTRRRNRNRVEYAAATQIQALTRGSQARARAAERRRAVLDIQRIARGRQGRERARRQRASITINRHAKGRLGRRRAAGLREKRAAETIQRRVRSRLAANQFHYMVETQLQPEGVLPFDMVVSMSSGDWYGHAPAQLPASLGTVQPADDMVKVRVHAELRWKLPKGELAGMRNVPAIIRCVVRGSGEDRPQYGAARFEERRLWRSFSVLQTELSGLLNEWFHSEAPQRLVRDVAEGRRLRFGGPQPRDPETAALKMIINEEALRRDFHGRLEEYLSAASSWPEVGLLSCTRDSMHEFLQKSPPEGFLPLVGAVCVLLHLPPKWSALRSFLLDTESAGVGMQNVDPSGLKAAEFHACKKLLTANQQLMPELRAHGNNFAIALAHWALDAAYGASRNAVRKMKGLKHAVAAVHMGKWGKANRSIFSDDEAMVQLRDLSSAPPSVIAVSTCVCLLLGQPPSLSRFRDFLSDGTVAAAALNAVDVDKLPSWACSYVEQIASAPRFVADARDSDVKAAAPLAEWVVGRLRLLEARRIRREQAEQARQFERSVGDGSDGSDGERAAAAKRVDKNDKVVFLGITRAELKELTALPSPPDKLVALIAALCIIFGIEPQWAAARQVLKHPRAMAEIISRFDADGVPVEVLPALHDVIVVRPFIENATTAGFPAADKLAHWVYTKYVIAAAKFPSKRLRTTDEAEALRKAHSILRGPFSYTKPCLLDISSHELETLLTTKPPPTEALPVMASLCLLVGEKPRWKKAVAFLRWPEAAEKRMRALRPSDVGDSEFDTILVMTSAPAFAATATKSDVPGLRSLARWVADTVEAFTEAKQIPETSRAAARRASLTYVAERSMLAAPSDELSSGAIKAAADDGSDGDGGAAERKDGDASA